MPIKTDRLLKIRHSMGLSQEALCEGLDMDPTIVTLWETGARVPSLPSLILLAEALKTSTDYLLGREGEDMDSARSLVRALDSALPGAGAVSKARLKSRKSSPKTRVIPANPGMAKRIRDLRAKKGWSLEAAAKKLDRSLATVTKWESQGKVRSADDVVSLADAFRVSTDYLLGIDKAHDARRADVVKRMKAALKVLAEK